MALLRRWPDGDHDEDVVATFRVADRRLTIGCVARQLDVLADADGETASVALTAFETETLAEMLAIALVRSG